MRILLYTKYFYPSLGGVEVVSDNLATAWTKAGHTVTLITNLPCRPEIDRPYRIVRHPTGKQLQQLVSQHDIIYSNGANLFPFWPAFKQGKPFAWTHYNYQLQCLDGCGWLGGAPAPLTPLASIVHHGRRKGGLLYALRGALTLAVKRTAAHLVDANIAITKHVATRQPLPRQVVIYNPIRADRFAVRNFEEAIRQLDHSDATFTFLGRLDKNKGVSDLLRAFALVRQREQKENGNSNLTLKLIGDGPARKTLEALAAELNIAQHVVWKGMLSQEDLPQEIQRSGICILPSAIEEPMGIVVLELMNAGKPLIVSAVGGLSECAGPAAKTFENGNWQNLAEVMQELARDRDQQRQLVSFALERSAEFDSERFSAAYLELFERVIHAKKPRALEHFTN
jgi:glycogen synthase